MLCWTKPKWVTARYEPVVSVSQPQSSVDVKVADSVRKMSHVRMKISHMT